MPEGVVTWWSILQDNGTYVVQEWRRDASGVVLLSRDEAPDLVTARKVLPKGVVPLGSEPPHAIVVVESWIAEPA